MDLLESLGSVALLFLVIYAIWSSKHGYFTNCNSDIFTLVSATTNTITWLKSPHTENSFSKLQRWMNASPFGYRIDSLNAVHQGIQCTYTSIYTRTLHHIRAIVKIYTSVHSLWFCRIKCHCLTTLFKWFLDLVHGNNKFIQSKS